jgi:hypothetical protein
MSIKDNHEDLKIENLDKHSQLSDEKQNLYNTNH